MYQRIGLRGSAGAKVLRQAGRVAVNWQRTMEGYGFLLQGL